MATGFLEVAILTFQTKALHQFTWAGTHTTWMTPLGYLILFALPGALLTLLSRWRPGLVTPAGAVLILAFLGFYSLWSLTSVLARYTLFLLAAGMAVQAARLTARHPGFLRVVRRSTGWLAGLLLALMTLDLGGHKLLETAADKSAVHPREGAPNVVLIVLDTVRALSLSLYGYERPTTPFLERLAQRGVHFEWAISNAPWTLPSHASMFTGRLPTVLSADWRVPLDRTFPTLAEVFSAQGYRTGGFVANLLYTTRESGLSRGFRHYEDYLLTLRQVLLSTGLWQEFRTLGREQWHRTRDKARRVWRESDRKDGEAVTRGFLRWAEADTTRPFFAFLNYFDAHSPPYSMLERAPQFRSGLKGPRHRDQDAYDASIAYLDRQIQVIWDELERSGMRDNTVLIITADHGEQFGEHNLIKHGNSLYVQLVRVPLLIIDPRQVPTGRAVKEPVSLRHLAATVLDLAGLKNVKPLPGRSLRPFWEADSGVRHSPIVSLAQRGRNARPNDPIRLGPIYSVVSDWSHYMRFGDGREEVYDLSADPLEERNLAQRGTAATLLPTLRTILAQSLADEASAASTTSISAASK